MTKLLLPPHPGETILEDCLKPLGMSVRALAKELHVTPARLSEIVRSKRSVTADTALRLARYFGSSPDFWLGLQLEYDLRMAQMASGKKIEKTVKVREAA